MVLHTVKKNEVSKLWPRSISFCSKVSFGMASDSFSLLFHEGQFVGVVADVIYWLMKFSWPQLKLRTVIGCTRVIITFLIQFSSSL